jgi:hypothetical protein
MHSVRSEELGEEEDSVALEERGDTLEEEEQELDPKATIEVQQHEPMKWQGVSWVMLADVIGVCFVLLRCFLFVLPHCAMACFSD